MRTFIIVMLGLNAACYIVGGLYGGVSIRLDRWGAFGAGAFMAFECWAVVTYWPES